MGSKSLRPIIRLELARFPSPEVPGNRTIAWRAVWYLISALFFQSRLLALLPNFAKAALLRVFGARVGQGFVCKPRVNIKYPWFLTLGDHVWLGEGVWIDNLCPVTMGSNVCISQGAKLISGSHDWDRPEFPFFAKPINVGDGVWITAFRTIRPGVSIPPHVAVLSDLPAPPSEKLDRM